MTGKFMVTDGEHQFSSTNCTGPWREMLECFKDTEAKTKVSGHRQFGLDSPAVRDYLRSWVRTAQWPEGAFYRPHVVSVPMRDVLVFDLECHRHVIKRAATAMLSVRSRS